MEQTNFEDKMKASNKEFLNNLKSEDEKERLWAIAKLEEAFYRVNFVPRFFIKKMSKMMKSDASAIIRTMAMRALYHQSSECWPLMEDDKKLIRKALSSHDKWLGSGLLNISIAREIDLIEQKMKWL